MTNRAALYFTDTAERPAFAGRADQRPALLAETFPALWWFCCFAPEDVVSLQVEFHDGQGTPTSLPCLGLVTSAARALERFERRLLSSQALLEPPLLEARERFLGILCAQQRRWLQLDISEIEPINMPESTDTESLDYHVRIVDTADLAEALEYANGHGLDSYEGRISATNRVEGLMGYEDIGPEDRTVSREYIPRFDAVHTPSRGEAIAPAPEEPSGFLAKPVTLIDAVRVVSLALVGFGARERERILALSTGAIAEMTLPTWGNAHGEFAANGQERLLVLPGLSEDTWPDFRKLLLRHTHELHAMTISGGEARPITAESPLRGLDRLQQRLSFGYDGIGFTADDLTASPLQLRFDPGVIASERHFASLISIAAHVSRKLAIDVAIANAGEIGAPFLTFAANGEMTYVPRT